MLDKTLALLLLLISPPPILLLLRDAVGVGNEPNAKVWAIIRAKISCNNIINTALAIVQEQL